jgi:steroid 5-alpha reductase family enzyme
MSVWILLGIGWAGCALVMMALYMVQLWKQDATIVDVGWSLLIGLLTLFYAWSLEINTVQQWVVLGIACVWSLRLTVYLGMNRVMGNKPEDGRYQSLRKKYGSKAQVFFVIFFQAQALIALIFSIPILTALYNTQSSFSILTIIGFLFGFGAILGEAAADKQLAYFRSLPDSKGKTCRAGLWRYSRHPNYFFEWLYWFAYIFLAYPTPFWWVTVAGPVIMLLFLFRLTGIPYTEKQALASRGDDYRQYQQTTSVFIPWFSNEEKR